jgi:phosphoribosylamine--glycine ligase/phosphoribosylaminoimidazole synthetase
MLQRRKRVLKNDWGNWRRNMKVLIVGSGGREHAMAWKAAQSPLLEKLWIVPGNPGTVEFGENIALSADDVAGVVRTAREHSADLVLVGPEAPLAAGLVDALNEAGVRAFGPTQAAAQIESSKVFSKQFMQRHGIPSARFAVFSDFAAAVDHLDQIDYPIVVKASGLAAGKGVILPETREEAVECLHSILLEGAFGAAGNEVVIEERLSGPEISLLAFSDGRTARAMIPAQDHKRLLDGDTGPNTGGMGAYAPAGICTPAMVEELTRTVLQPTVDGLRAEGKPYVGVLYAGIMLTGNGPRVLEFNCRFGDPETQVLLPLLKSDLLEIAMACTEGCLEGISIEWEAGSAACVVLASEGYPGKATTGCCIQGLKDLPESTVAFHSGTRMGQQDTLVNAGGRVLALTGWGATLDAALSKAYAAVERVHFDGMQYRRDIGQKGLRVSSAYASSGVSIDAGNQAVALMSQAVRSTYTPAVLAGIGAFGGLFAADAVKALRAPVLVASTDGVGTKVKLAVEAGSYRSIGQDIVNHCINDILVQAARPLFFLDYFATSRLDPVVIAEIVSGISEACRAAGCVLLGGETAEMPGVYTPGEFDVAGTIVGLVEREAILPRKDLLQAGDVLVGLRSSGPHTNGYSLIRRIFVDVPLTAVLPELGIPLGDALLAPHRSYLNLLGPVLENHPRLIKALAHLTGGGFIENIPRVLPDDLLARVFRGSWPVPMLFRLMQQRCSVAEEEMYRVFNMGIGMVVVVAKEDAAAFQTMLGEESWIIGELARGAKKVALE